MNIGAPWPDLQEAELRVRGMQSKLHRWAVADPDRRFKRHEPPSIGTNTGRAGCGESRTSGSEGGPQKPTRCETNRALRSDPTSATRRCFTVWW